MKIIEQDILTVEDGIIFQSVNCVGPQGGLAGAIKRKWPIVGEEYQKHLKTEKPENNWKFLGTHTITRIEGKNLYVCNIFGQLNISTKERQTEYCAIKSGFESFIEKYGESQFQIYFPWQFGSGLGGGDWNIVKNIIDYYFPDAIICKLPNT